MEVTEKEILALGDRRYQAMTSQNWPALEALLHDDLVYTHSSGVADTRASWLAAMKSGKTKYKSARCGERKVRIYGDVALVSGKADFEAEVNGQPRSLKLAFLEAWAKTPQGWKFVAWQSTPQPA
jgi:ketosteroid isomerase-like protein